MDLLVIVLVASLAGSLLSLAGGMLILSRKIPSKWVHLIGVPFAAGALLAASFLDLMPEMVEKGAAEQGFAIVLAGFLLFFLLERFLKWFHHHHAHEDDSIHPAAKLIAIGDTLHNFIDGLIIGVAFLTDISTGIITTIAVAAHEIPQEVGDFGLMLSYGMSRKRVLLINFLSAMATVVAALLVVGLFGDMSFLDAPLLALAAGFFIYIAASDIIPTIHEAEGRTANIQAAVLVAGVAAIGLTIMATHGIIEA